MVNEISTLFKMGSSSVSKRQRKIQQDMNPPTNNWG